MTLVSFMNLVRDLVVENFLMCSKQEITEQKLLTL